MRYAPRPESHVAGTGMELVVANLDYVLSFEHVPQFVFVLVNVEGSVERRDFFYDAKGTASSRARGSNDELGIAEPQTFTAICSGLVAAGLSHGSNCSPETEAYLPMIRPPRRLPEMATAPSGGAGQHASIETDPRR